MARMTLRATILSVIVLICAGAAQFVLAQTSPDRQLPLSDPDAGLSDAEKAAAHEANTAGYQERYAAWLDAFLQRGIDPRSLERRPMSGGRALDPRPSLDASVREADLVVEVVAESVTFEFHHMYALTTARVRLESVMKGSLEPGDVVDVKFLGGPHPVSSEFRSDEAILRYDAPTPLLLPGERAILFLEERSEAPFKAGEYAPHSFTGVFPVLDNVVGALEGNPFREDVAGLLVDEFKDQIIEAR